MSALTLIPGMHTIARLPPDAPVPAWAAGGSFVSVTRTPYELSILCEQSNVPSEVTCEGSWRGLMVAGPLDFNLTGVLANLAAPLAAAAISILAIATYDTDYVFVRTHDLSRAVDVLRKAGHTVSGDLAS